MSDDLDLRGIDHRHEPDPEFRAALQRRLAAIVAGTDPGSVTEARDLATIDLEPNLPTPGTSILGRIADQEPDTETEIVMLTEATPSTPTPTPTRRWMLLAAAAVVALVVAGIALVNNSDDDQSPSPTAVATVAPTTTVPTVMETVHFAASRANIPVTFSVPYDWTFSEERHTAYKGLGIGSVGLNIDEIPNIYADGCQWLPLDPPVGPTVDDLAEAWANLPGFAATGPVDVTVDGYAGKQIEFTVPDHNIAECKGPDSPVFGLWTAYDHAFPGFEAQGRDQHTLQRILDVGGTRLVITAYDVPSTSPQDRAALETALASIQIG